jgi:hypothetical protein
MADNKYIQTLIVEYLLDQKRPCTLSEVFTFLRTEGAVDDPGQMADPVVDLVAEGTLGRINVDNNTVFYLACVEEARDRLSTVLPHIRLFVEAAKIERPGSKVELGILATSPDNSGKVVARFNLEFLDDIGTLTGEIKPPTGGEKISDDR